jgi:putative SOS response-associated peptidase YedK
MSAPERKVARVLVDRSHSRRGKGHRLPGSESALVVAVGSQFTEMPNDLYAFLTTDANAEVGAIHPKAMPVILTTTEEIEIWMTAPAPEVLKLQRPLPGGALKVVARDEKTDGD